MNCRQIQFMDGVQISFCPGRCLQYILSIKRLHTKVYWRYIHQHLVLLIDFLCDSISLSSDSLKLRLRQGDRLVWYEVKHAPAIECLWRKQGKCKRQRLVLNSIELITLFGHDLFLFETRRNSIIFGGL